MLYCKGQITHIRQCSGCVEVTVVGEAPGCFPIDNRCFAMLIDADGAELLGRQIEYVEGHLRFLDTVPARTDPERGPAPIISRR